MSWDGRGTLAAENICTCIKATLKNIEEKKGTHSLAEMIGSAMLKVVGVQILHVDHSEEALISWLSTSLDTAKELRLATVIRSCSNKFAIN